ncbi:MAG: peptidoglycan DD-metalloendopeptidase family protein [Desulfarculaceae bacterium]
MAKKYTILIIPQDTRNVRRFTTPRWVLPFLLVLFMVSVGMAGFWFQKFQSLSLQLPDRLTLEQRQKFQDTQLQALAARLASYKQQMAQLQSFNHRLRVLANLEKPGEKSAFFGVGGAENSQWGPGVRLSQSARDRQIQSMQRDLDRLKVASETELEVQRELAKFLKERRSILASTPSIWPVRGWVTSGFGNRLSPFTGKRQFHAGLDISNRRGTPIKAPAEGVVTFAGREGGFGRMLVLNHGHGIVTRYGHLNKFHVKVGQKVTRGQVVANLGNSGRSTGPHLHYEVLLSGVPTNPRYYILD